MSIQEHWGAAAVGVSDGYYTEVDEAQFSPDTWEVEFWCHAIQIRFRIDSPAKLEELLSFFQKTHNEDCGGRIIVGDCCGHPLILIKDDEFVDRYFIHVAGEKSTADHNRVYIRITLAGKALEHVMTALHQVVEELNE